MTVVVFSIKGVPSLKVVVRGCVIAIAVIIYIVVVLAVYKSTIMMSKVDTTTAKSAVAEDDEAVVDVVAVVDLLEGLPPLPNYDFPAEVSFRTSMEEAGVPNLEDFQTCPPSNMVLWRRDTGMLPDYYRKDFIRDFSIGPRDFQWQRHNKTCSTVQEMTDAIKYGKRVWENRNSSWTWKEEELASSSFKYHGCDIPILSPADICRILSQFSHVYFVGDSLNRHVHDGFHIALRNDFTSGSMLTDKEEILQNCRCDGQFSERLICRDKFTYPSPGFREPFSPEYGVCPPADVSSTINNNNINNINNKTENDTTTKTNNNNNNNSKGPIVEYRNKRLVGDTSMDCSLNTTKPVLLLINGGATQPLNPQATYQELMKSLLHNQIRECARRGKLIVIWQSFVSKSPSHDVLYPTQKRDLGIIFNDKMRELLSPDNNNNNNNSTDNNHNRKQLLNILFVDHMNFTTGAQSSDGMHLLINGNYFRAQHYLHLANLMLKEQMFATY